MNNNNVHINVKKQVEPFKALSPKRKKVIKHDNGDSAPKRSIVSLMAAAIFVGLLIVSIWVFFKGSTYSADATIAQDLKKLQLIFGEIDKDCKIVDFEHAKNYIDFLTVKEFVGSQIGGLHLANPRNWKGPYLQVNPKVHEQQYIVLKNKRGYYLVPGDGVVLENGKTIGTDIVFNDKTDIEALLQNPDGLKSSQGVLASKITIGGSHVNNLLLHPMNSLALEG